MKLVLKIGIIFLLIFVVLSCKKPKKYSEIPEIKFESFLLKDTIDNPELQNPVKMGILRFAFTDGDGNIGLAQSDTNPPYDSASVYHYNLYYKMFEIKNGKIEEVDLPFPLNFRTPLVASSGQNKTLKGWIETEFTYNYPLQFDSLIYTFFMYDRAQNKSNVESTDTIVIVN